ncbi:ABC transporter substrate-binding protein [Truepera radiovictrix]|uniref:Extracellular solute-binding protein family 5 n=1 Tax=Truepera radiovictrix (strain DSM 17093 / CIP 108686 / LMG 22925 / RQ-24) TaxID=649638 RepID=D7CUA7_TRURR|nr:ABC transporter substrate-binding protein [Truepera radiovictrix]ADI15692.1 extracellular solute-binding protein family 5 [Truepera radiovictrix DSM 17093]WMT58680.1 ABC transporter substrate-binding protein [Truepera radiovictrix]
MKHLLALSTLLFAASAVGAPPPQQGGEITVAIVVEPPGWDPTVSNSQEINRVTYGNVYEGLVMLNRHGEITPGLAESWEVSEDGLSWTFTLREGVTFHDGSTFTAEDVLAKFERARDPDAGHTHPEYYTAIDTVSAEGNTVTFTLTHPSASLLYNLARPSSIIYPAGTEETQRTAPVGTGPFRFAEWVRGSEVRLERFDDYHGESAYLDAVTFRIIEDPSAQLAALQAGDIDMVGVALSPENALQVQADPNLKLTEGSATTEITLAMNNAREPLSDLRVRQAITHAIDKQAIIEGALFGFGTPIGTHASPIEPYFIDVEPYPYDPERARELLAEAGFEDGLTLTFELPPYPIERRVGEVIAQQLADVGITANVTNVEWTTWLERIFTNADYELTIIGHSEPRDIGIYGNPEYYFRYNNRDVQALLEQAERAVDETERNELLKEVAQRIADEAVNVWVLSPPYLVAARADLYGFWEDQPTPAINLTEAYLAQP